MRTLLFALAVLAANAPASQAQAPTFGVKGGLNVASATFEFAEFILDFAGVDKVPQLGFVGGVTADIPFSTSLGLRAEVLYSQKGYGIEVQPNDRGISATGPATTSIDYLEVPLLLASTFAVQDGLEITTHIGVAPAFKLSESFTCVDADRDPEAACADPDDEVSDESTIESFDLGAAIGLGVGAGPFSVEGRYTYGITQLNTAGPDDNGLSFFDGDAHNSVFSIAAVYRFGR